MDGTEIHGTFAGSRLKKFIRRGDHYIEVPDRRIGGARRRVSEGVETEADIPVYDEVPMEEEEIMEEDPRVERGRLQVVIENRLTKAEKEQYQRLEGPEWDFE